MHSAWSGRTVSIIHRAVQHWQWHPVFAHTLETCRPRRPSSPVAPVEGAIADDCGSGTLRGRCNLDVYAEVIGPFRFMPRVVLQTGGNAVMSALVNALLPMFMKRCAPLLHLTRSNTTTSPSIIASSAERFLPHKCLHIHVVLQGGKRIRFTKMACPKKDHVSSVRIV